MIKYLILILSVSSLLLSFSCRKKASDYDTNTRLAFSTDTITFDTIFTTIGSSTAYFMIYNPSNQPVLISNIHLAGGAQSNFRINIDGLSGPDIKEVRIEGNDSLFGMVEVTVDPNGGNTPMLITDSIIFVTNGIIQDIDLLAYGQDAYFIMADRHIAGLPPFHIVAGEGVDTTWTADKPIVIYGYAVVDSTAVLRIEEGSRIYFHANSGLWVYKGGALKVNGSLGKEVSFQGDRPESSYEDVPGQWDRIWLNEGSIDNEINYAVIKNAFIGLQTETLQQPMGNKLKLTNTTIYNCSGAGILSRYYHIEAENLVVANCQQYALALTMGGKYSFTHATIANYWNYSIRKTPALYFNNYFKDYQDVVYPFDMDQAHFSNCIIYGDENNEIVADSSSQGGVLHYYFDHCLIRTEQPLTDSRHWNSIINQQDPLFNNVGDNDYHLMQQSPAKAYGIGGLVPIDIEGKTRDINTPNLGAYEELVTGN